MVKVIDLFKKKSHTVNRQLILAEGIRGQSEREKDKHKTRIEQLEYELAVKEGIINTLQGQIAHIKMIDDRYSEIDRLMEDVNPAVLKPGGNHSNTKVEIKEDHFTVSQSVYQPARSLGLNSIPQYAPMLRQDKLCGNCGVPSVNYRKYPDAINAHLKDGLWHIDVLGELICVLPDRVIDQINEYKNKKGNDYE